MVLVWSLATAAGAKMFSYRDRDGKVHFVDQESSIPAEYRSQATESTAPNASGSVTPMPAAEPADGGSASGSPDDAGAPDDSLPPSCALKYVDKPAKTIDAVLDTVDYQATMENSGTGIARGVRAHLKLFSAIDGSMIDQATAVLQPSDLAPQARGTFQIRGEFRKMGLRNSERDDLMVDFVRCDRATAVTKTDAPQATCPLKLVGEPAKQVDLIRKLVVYTGSIENHGQGTARTVQVVMQSFSLQDGRVIRTLSVNPTPPSLGPGQVGTFRIVAPQDFGFRDPYKDHFDVTSARCD